jgi:hypothetical protein
MGPLKKQYKNPFKKTKLHVKLKPFSHSFIFSRIKEMLITRAPTPPPALMMIHLFDPLGK